MRDGIERIVNGLKRRTFAVLLARIAQLQQEFLTTDFADDTDGKEDLSVKSTVDSLSFFGCGSALCLGVLA